MNTSALQFKIAQIRQEKQTAVMANIAVIVFMLFIVAMLPNLLINFYYANQNLTEAPALLGQIPLAAFVVGALDFLFTLFTWVRLSIKARKLEKELDSMAMMDDSCCANGCNCGGSCNCDEDCNCADCGYEMMEIEMDDKEDTSALASAMSAKSKSKKATSKARRK